MDSSYYISMEEYLMGRDKLYPLDDEQIGNANTIVPKANELLELFYTANPNAKRKGVASGYRPEAINAATPNASKKSNHIKCLAIDIEDHDGELDKWCLANLAELEKIGLWLESPTRTINWCHLQAVSPKSGNRVYMP